MAGVFDEARAKLKALRDSFNSILKNTFDKQKKLIIEYNAEEQMYRKGETSKGSLIRPAYSRTTIKLKRAKGQPINRVTLRDTGRFHRTLIITPHEDYLEISSDLAYSKFLLEKYGDDVLGLQEELLKDFIKMYVLPEIKREADAKL